MDRAAVDDYVDSRVSISPEIVTAAIRACCLAIGLSYLDFCTAPELDGQSSIRVNAMSGAVDGADNSVASSEARLVGY